MFRNGEKRIINKGGLCQNLIGKLMLWEEGYYGCDYNYAVKTEVTSWGTRRLVVMQSTCENAANMSKWFLNEIAK